MTGARTVIAAGSALPALLTCIAAGAPPAAQGAVMVAAVTAVHIAAHVDHARVHAAWQAWMSRQTTTVWRAWMTHDTTTESTEPLEAPRDHDRELDHEQPDHEPEHASV